MERNAVVTGVGHYVPPKVLTNKELEKLVDTNDEWIVSRTGIRERRILEDKDKASAYMGYQAAKMILDEKNLSPDEIDLIVVATVTPDTMFPSNACRIQHMLGATNAWGMDVNGACTGFIYALTTGAQFIRTGMHKKSAGNRHRQNECHCRLYRPHNLCFIWRCCRCGSAGTQRRS
jgi:3-oxoacyl-[acyl-carrier-protein] synthase-3